MKPALKVWWWRQHYCKHHTENVCIASLLKAVLLDTPCQNVFASNKCLRKIFAYNKLRGVYSKKYESTLHAEWVTERNSKKWHEPLLQRLPSPKFNTYGILHRYCTDILHWNSKFSKFCILHVMIDIAWYFQAFGRRLWCEWCFPISCEIRYQSVIIKKLVGCF